MKQIRIGDVTIDSAIEREGPWRRPQDFFPAYDETVFRHHLPSMEPEVWDEALGKIVMTLLAFSSAALAQQQQCQLECTLVTQSGEARVTKSCYALDAEQCALVAKANTGGQQTCRGYLTTNCVNDR